LAKFSVGEHDGRQVRAIARHAPAEVALREPVGRVWQATRSHDVVKLKPTEPTRLALDRAQRGRTMTPSLMTVFPARTASGSSSGLRS
jgi:hypothetical protein